MIGVCLTCGKVGNLKSNWPYYCYSCLGKDRVRDDRNKGVRSYQQIVNYFLVLDRQRGSSYGQLAKAYGMDRSEVNKRIKRNG